ncbi:MAG: sulfatase-like hydrolase/transferase, partial [Cellulophaga baltica]
MCVSPIKNIVLSSIALLCFGSFFSCESVQELPQKPNVILLVVDDQGYGDIGRLGNKILKTPNIDALYDESARFTQYHVSPTCAPTRAALMTGHHSNRAGVWHTVNGRSLLLERE